MGTLTTAVFRSYKQWSAETSLAVPLACLASNIFELNQASAHSQACLACKGAILFTGIGKSGFIAQKVCQTLVSTGTKAVFLSPTDALHGDIGILSREDLLVLVSKSGATDELLRLVPYARVRHRRVAAVPVEAAPPLTLIELASPKPNLLLPCTVLTRHCIPCKGLALDTIHAVRQCCTPLRRPRGRGWWR